MTNKRITWGMLCLCALVASETKAELLFDNSAGRNLGAEGMETYSWPWRRLESELLHYNTAYGFSCYVGFALADDFGIGPKPWRIDSIELYAYQTTHTTPSVIGGTFRIVRDNAGAPSWGPVGTGTWSSSVFTHIYRSSNRRTTDDRRRIQRVTVDFNGLVLEPNQRYWIVWSLEGINGIGGPFSPPLTSAHSISPPGSLNAMQYYNELGWRPVVDPGSASPKDLPFKVFGSELK